ncbi:MAG: hypothetical protein ACJAYU_004546 [Bradymonadia bacterium]|jgi:hypothetical protein
MELRRGVGIHSAVEVLVDPTVTVVIDEITALDTIGVDRAGCIVTVWAAALFGDVSVAVLVAERRIWLDIDLGVRDGVGGDVGARVVCGVGSVRGSINEWCICASVGLGVRRVGTGVLRNRVGLRRVGYVLTAGVRTDWISLHVLGRACVEDAKVALA